MEDTELIGKIDLNEIYKEWAAEEVTENYADPSTGWNLKFYTAFEGNRLVLLFENSGGENPPYYREMVYGFREYSPEMNFLSKMRFRTDGFLVDGFEMHGDDLFAAMHHPDTWEEDFSVFGPGEFEEGKTICNRKDLEKRSEDVVPFLNGNELMLIRLPFGCRVDYSEYRSAFMRRLPEKEDESC